MRTVFSLLLYFLGVMIMDMGFFTELAIAFCFIIGAEIQNEK